MAGIPTIGVTGSTMGVSGVRPSGIASYAERANTLSNNMAALTAASSSRGSAIALAGSSQALANQTGGNIMGFTYE